MNNYVGCCTVELIDNDIGITFPMIVMYPTNTPGKVEKLGPYDINISVNTPIKAGIFPLTIISHGAGGSPLVYRTLAHHLASNGFIVGMPEHPFNNRNNNSWENTIDNLVNRPKHLKIALDSFFTNENFAKYLKPNAISLIGHSIGGYTALALAGGKPTPLPDETSDKQSKQFNVVHDSRIKALVLLAPASVWFQNEKALSNVTCPIFMLVGDKDEFTGPCCPIFLSHKKNDKDMPYGYHAQLIFDGVPDSSKIQFKFVRNAGHFSFLSPFPESMTNKTFPPSQDPPGFNRKEFLEALNMEVLDFLRNQA